MPDNQRKKILLASPFFYPEPISTGKYNTFFVEKLAEQEHDVTVICSHPFYPAWKTEFTGENLKSVITIRGGLKIVYPGSTIARRLVLEVWYAWHFFKEARRMKGLVDVVVAVVPPVFFTLFVNPFFKEARKVAIVHDLLGIMATSSNNLPRRLVGLIMRQCESFLLRRFDTVICLSEAMKKVLITQYGLKRSACNVFYPFATIVNTASERNVLKDVFPAGFHHIVYSGALGEKQKPGELYRFFENLCDSRTDIYCHIFSRGPICDELEKHNRNKQICFHDLVPEDCLSDLYACSDIQVVPQAEGTGAGAFPSKLPNLIASGVPVLAICDRESDLARVILETGAGEAVSGWDFQELCRALDSLLQNGAEIPRMHRQAIAETYIREKFNIDRLIASIINA
ncbi:MAG: glycosyltransferase [Syntrophaceae bacterium]|nr:glycosyltransferase [Syntrophaceae bacterium]